MGINEKLDLVELELFKANLRIKELEEVVLFYAKKRTYETDVINQWQPLREIDKDSGKRARGVLR